MKIGKQVRWKSQSVDELIALAKSDVDCAKALVIRAYSALHGSEPLVPPLRRYLAEALFDIASGVDPASALNLKRGRGRPKGSTKDRDLCFAAAVQVVDRQKQAGLLGSHQESDPIGLVADMLNDPENSANEPVMDKFHDPKDLAHDSYRTIEKAVGAYCRELSLLTDEELHLLAETVVPNIRTAFKPKAQAKP